MSPVQFSHMAGLSFMDLGLIGVQLHMLCFGVVGVTLRGLFGVGFIGFVIVVWSLSVCVMFLMTMTGVECCLVFWRMLGGSCRWWLVMMCRIVGEFWKIFNSWLSVMRCEFCVFVLLTYFVDCLCRFGVLIRSFSILCVIV